MCYFQITREIHLSYHWYNVMSLRSFRIPMTPKTREQALLLILLLFTMVVIMHIYSWEYFFEFIWKSDASRGAFTRPISDQHLYGIKPKSMRRCWRSNNRSPKRQFIFRRFYWFLIDISYYPCFRSFKSPTSSSKLLMRLDLGTGFWNVLWTAPRSAPGSIMQLVTRSVWLVTISLRDGGRPPTGLMTKWSAPLTILAWCPLSTERYCAHRSHVAFFSRALTSDVKIAVVRANIRHSRSISLSTDYRDL